MLVVHLWGGHTDAILFDETVSDSDVPVPLADTPSSATAASCVAFGFATVASCVAFGFVTVASGVAFGFATVAFGFAFAFSFRMKIVVERVGERVMRELVSMCRCVHACGILVAAVVVMHTGARVGLGCGVECVGGEGEDAECM